MKGRQVTDQANANVLARWFPNIAIAVGVCVFLQAILAGRGWFIDYDLIKVHGYVGEITFVLTLLLLISAWLGRQAGLIGIVELGLTALLMVLLVAQLALGYSGRDSGTAASLHVPNAILITGITAALITLGQRRSARTGAA
jgi:hypothetical protein